MTQQANCNRSTLPKQEQNNFKIKVSQKFCLKKKVKLHTQNFICKQSSVTS